MANNSSNMAIAFLLLILCAVPLRAESQAVPPDTWLYPPGGSDASSFELLFAQAVSNAPTQLLFDGSVQNSSFLNGANVSFWFDWSDADGTPHTTQPEAFTLTPIMGSLYRHSSEYFSRVFVIPYSPAEVSIYFANETATSLDGWPVLVAGTLTTVPEPVTAILLSTASIALPFQRLRRPNYR